jgi:AcrR family transcriptional regulator
VSPAGRPVQTTPEQWAQAALAEIERAGVGALAVQSVARALGVSKGGFYHHFASRRELLLAALALWQERYVEQLTLRFEAVVDPRQRLHALLVHAGIELEPTVIVQLMAAADDPDVEAALARAASSRMELLEGIFAELGFTAAQSRNRAVLAYSAYLGLAELRRHAPGVLASPAQMRAYLNGLEQALLRREPDQR